MHIPCRHSAEKRIMTSIDRRALLAAMAATGASGQVFAQPRGEQLLVVMWGAQWIEVCRPIGEEWMRATGDRIQWELHAGGAMAVVGRLRPLFPRIQQNLIAAWDPVFDAMMEAGWMEPVSEAEMPALRDIPDIFFKKNAAGQKMTVPLSTAGAFWGYRTDLVSGTPIESIEQLLEPRFRGKLCVPVPVNLSGLLLVSLAMQRGGNERNIEPGWAFMRELAERGQIGRVVANNSEMINAMSAGDLSVAFWNTGGWQAVRERFPCRLLTRLNDNKGFLFNEGFAVMKGDNPGRVAAAKRFANHFATAPINTRYNIPLGSGPTNIHSTPAPAIEGIFYTPDELPRYAYIPDYAYMATQVDGWTRRWETEITPLIRRA
jgi:putative spermidine/putrescine transport system substrate-binding protein